MFWDISGPPMKTPLFAFFALALLVGNSDAYAAAPSTLLPSAAASAAGGQESADKILPLQPTETRKQLEKKKKRISSRRGALVAAPLPIVSPAIGSGIIPVVGYIFPFSKNDKISPPSTIGAAGLVTNNGSSGFGLAAQLFMKENRYAITSLYVHGNVNYNLYGIGIPAGNGNLKVPLDQAGQLYFGEALRRIP